MSDRKRLLNDLRVIDLRAELEKRNLDKGGVRSVLLQRLAKHLEEEGLDPATHNFEIAGPELKTPSKRGRRSESAVDQETEDAPAMEDMIVQDDAGEEEESEQTTKDDETSEETKPEELMEVEQTEKVNRKRDSKDEPDVSPAKKPCLEKDTKNEDEFKADANTDAEDSINLDINEDELINDEEDNNTKSKEDEGGEQTTAASDQRPAGEAAPDRAELQNDQLPDNAETAANSNEGEKIEEKDGKDTKDKDGVVEKSEKKEDGKESGARNLWISGLSGDTRAKDLKQLCTKYGKVIGAKVVTNARTPGSRCYGYVTMASAQDAENCIKNLHRTELHGRMISVEKAKSESESASRRQPSRNERRSSKERKEEGKENEEKKEVEKDEEGNEKPKLEGEGDEENSRSQSRTREKSNRSDKDKKRSTRSRERGGGRRSPREVLSFSKIWKERDAARARSRARAAREEERRRRAADDALRERERRQRQEKHRLALEREKLRQEREKIEREKNELLRLERERHRLEREKLELERLELKRAQLRLEEERRKRGYETAYRKAGSPPPEPAYERDRHKRAPPQPPKLPSSRSGHFEAPPPPRFDVSASYERDKRDNRDTRDYKRDYPRHPASTSIKYTSNGNTNDDARQPMPPGTRPKEPSRTYESRETRPYRSPPAAAKQEPRWTAAPVHDAHNKGSTGMAEWSDAARYSGGYGARYAAAFQPPPPGAAYPDRYPPPRDYHRKY